MYPRKGELAAVAEFRRRQAVPVQIQDSIQFYLLQKWSAVAEATQAQPDQRYHQTALEQCTMLLAEITAGQLDPLFTFNEGNEFNGWQKDETPIWGYDLRDTVKTWWRYDDGSADLIAATRREV